MASVHRETFVELVNTHGWRRGAELGVDKGILTRMLLQGCRQLSLIAVDTFPDPERSRRVPQLAEAYQRRLTVHAMTTVAASELVPDHSLDFVFIDADHGRKAVQQDIECWRHKVKPGGWLGGHDYTPKWPGVPQAVDATFRKGTVQHYPGTIWGVWV